jgi:transposase
VYGWERLVLLRHLLEQGLSKAAIARQLGVSRRVIYCWIETGQLERDLGGTAPRGRTGRPGGSSPTSRSSRRAWRRIRS